MVKMVTKYERNKSLKIYFCFLFFVFVSLFLFVNVSGDESFSLPSNPWNADDFHVVDKNGGGIGTGIFWEPNGDKYFLSHSYDDYVKEYTCDDSWDYRSCSLNYEMDISDVGNKDNGMYWKPNGNRFWLGRGAEFSCSNSWDLSSCSLVDEHSEGYNGVFWGDGGNKYYSSDRLDEEITEYDCPNDYDLSNCDNTDITHTLDVSDIGDGAGEGIFWKPDGNTMYTGGSFKLYEFSCSNSWDLSSCSYTDRKTDDDTGKDFYIRDDGEKIWSSGLNGFDFKLFDNYNELNTEETSGTGGNKPLNVDLSVDTSGTVDGYYDIRYYNTYDTLLCEKTGVPVGSSTTCTFEDMEGEELNEDTRYQWDYEIDYDGETYTVSDKKFTTGILNISTKEPEDVDFTSFIMKGELSDIYGSTSANLSFEYRKSGSSTWNSTDVLEQSSSGGTSYEYNLTDLEDGELYEYRAVVDDEYKTKEGETYEVLTNSTDPTIKNIDSSVNYSDVELTGNLSDMGVHDEVYTSFEYREDGEDSWENTEPKVKTETQEFSEEITGLEYSQNYEWRTCVEFNATKKCNSIDDFKTGRPFDYDIPSPSPYNFKYYNKHDVEYTIDDIEPDYNFDLILAWVEVEDSTCEDGVPINFITERDKLKTCNSYDEKIYENWNETGEFKDVVSPLDSGTSYHFIIYGVSDSYEDTESYSDSLKTKEGNPVSSIEQLFGIRTDLNESYYLTEDLDFCSEDSYRDPYSGFVSIENLCEERGAEEGWVPIEDKFEGELDGLGYSINNLYIDRANQSEVGLFESIGEHSNVSRLGIYNTDIKGNNDVGIISGKLYDNATIKEIYLNGNVEGNERVGGYFGFVDYHEGRINDTYYIGNVECDDICGLITGKSLGVNYTGDTYYDEWSVVNRAYLIGDVFSSDFSDKGVLSGYAGNYSTFYDVFFSVERLSENWRKLGKYDGSLEEKLHNVEEKSEYDMKLTDTLDEFNFNYSTVLTTDERDESSTWNIVEYDSFPFLSVQNEFIEFDKLGQPELKEEIPDFDLGFDTNFTFDLSEFFNYVDDYKFKIDDEWYTETDPYKTSYGHIGITDGEMYFETEDIPVDLEIKVRAINGAGSTDDDFELRIMENPQKDFYRGEAEEPEGFITKAVDSVLDLFPDERQLSDIQKIGFVILILAFVTIITLLVGGLSATTISLALIFDFLIFILLSFLGYVPTAIFVWLGLGLIVFVGFKIFKKYQGGE